MQVSSLWGTLSGAVLGCALIAGCASAPSPPPAPPPHTRDAEICPAVETLVPGTDSDYARELVARIGSHAFYPKSAVTYSQAGVVHLCVLMDRQGNIQKALVNTSTGYPLLDGAALYAVGRTRADGSMDVVPQELGGGARNIWFEVPVSFTLPGEKQPGAATAAGSDSVCLHGGARRTMPDWERSAEFKSYEQQISKKFQEQMIYPKEAVAQREEGRAVICIQVSRDGGLKEGRIWQSAGDPLFDGVLLMSVGVVILRKDLGPFPDVVPQDLDNISFNLPMVWSIR